MLLDTQVSNTQGKPFIFKCLKHVWIEVRAHDVASGACESAPLRTARLQETRAAGSVTCPGVRHSFALVLSRVEELCQTFKMQSVSRQVTPVLSAALRASSVSPRHPVRSHIRTVQTARQAFFGARSNCSRTMQSKKIGRCSSLVPKLFSKALPL